jgi:putative photosynthetic complex assembly protein
MSAAMGNRALPRALLGGVGLMLAGLIAGAGFTHHSIRPTEVPVSTPVQERDFVFKDRGDGAITVWDAKNGQLVTTLVGQNGFLRATLRGLAQQRKREDNDEQTPFHLTQWADGRLTLDDPVTARHVELEAFGATNEDVFAQLLMHKDTAP